VSATKRRYPWFLPGAMLCALGLVLIAVVTADLRKINESLAQDTHIQLRLLRDIFHDEFSSVLRSFDAASFQLSEPIENNDIKKIHQQLDLLKIAIPSIANVIARNSSGEVIGETLHDQDLINTQANFSSNPVLNSHTRLVSFEKSFNSTGQLVLVINYQVKNKHGEMLGLLQGRLNATYMQRKLASLRLGKQMYSGVAFQDGSVLLLEPEQKNIHELVLPYSFSDKERLVDNGLFQDHLFASEPLSKLNELDQEIPLYLITWADTRPMVAAWKEQTIKLFLGYLVFCTIVLLMVRARIIQQLERFLASEQAVADQHLHDERFKLATESAGIGVWEYNLEDKHMRWDKAMRKIYGVREEQELIGYKEWLDYLDPEDVNKLGTILKEAPNTREAFEFGFNIRRASGIGQRIV
jgi:PAS domain-containing protein